MFESFEKLILYTLIDPENTKNDHINQNNKKDRTTQTKSIKTTKQHKQKQKNGQTTKTTKTEGKQQKADNPKKHQFNNSNNNADNKADDINLNGDLNDLWMTLEWPWMTSEWMGWVKLLRPLKHLVYVIYLSVPTLRLRKVRVDNMRKACYL